MSKVTASKAWLIHEADTLEKSAKDSLPTWVLLGQSGRFSAYMAKVASLREIADVKNLTDRRYRLRELGYET